MSYISILPSASRLLVTIHWIKKNFIRKKVAQMNLYSWYFMSIRKIMIRDWLQISIFEKNNVGHQLSYGPER